MLSGQTTDLFEVYKLGRASERPEERYLAFRAHDLCRAYVRRASYPAAEAHPDGDSMRRATAIQALMLTRCKGFESERLNQFLDDGKKLTAWYVDENNPMSPNFVHLPRHASPEQIETLRQRWLGLIEQQGASAIAGREGSFSEFLEVVGTKQDAGAQNGLKLRSPEAIAAASLALCHAGFDCSATSNTYGVVCGVHGSCEPSLAQVFLKGLSADEAAAVNARAQWLGRSLAARDVVALGLRPP